MEIPDRQVHPVTIVVRKSERVIVDRPHEPRISTFVRAGRAARIVGGRDEEHVERGDEFTVRWSEGIVYLHLLEPVGQPPGVEPVLELAAPLVVDARHETLPDYQTFQTMWLSNLLST